MNVDAIADQIGLPLVVVESYVADATNDTRPFPPIDHKAIVAKAAARREEMGFSPLPEPADKEYTYNSAELPIAAPEE